MRRIKRTARLTNQLAICIFLYTPVYQFFSRAVDGAHRAYDINGDFAYVSSAHFTPIIGAAFTVIIAVLLFLVIVELKHDNEGQKRTEFDAGYTLLLLLIGISDLCYWRDWGALALARQAIFFVSLTILASTGLTLRTVRRIAYLYGLSLFGIAAFAVIEWQQAWLPCRADKCTVANGLLAGFFPHETAQAIFVLTGLPLIFFINNRFAKSLIGLTGLALVYFSGSRAAWVGAAIFLIVMLFKNRRWALLIPIGSMVLSVYDFITASGADLTGRGYIYDALRSALSSNPWFGSGPHTLENAFNNANLSFFVNHQHGEAPYLISDFGVLVFVVAASLLVFRCIQLYRLNDIVATNLAMPLVIGSTMLATETMFTFTIDSQVQWAMLLFLIPFTLRGRTKNSPIANFILRRWG